MNSSFVHINQKYFIQTEPRYFIETEFHLILQYSAVLQNSCLLNSSLSFNSCILQCVCIAYMHLLTSVHKMCLSNHGAYKVNPILSSFQMYMGGGMWGGWGGRVRVVVLNVQFQGPTQEQSELKYPTWGTDQIAFISVLKI